MNILFQVDRGFYLVVYQMAINITTYQNIKIKKLIEISKLIKKY